MKKNNSLFDLRPKRSPPAWYRLGYSFVRKALMRPKLIPTLLEALKEAPSSSTVQNIYQDPALAENLTAYLLSLCRYPYSGHLIVGTAPTSTRTGVTGIPFCSEFVLQSVRHPFLDALMPKLHRSEKRKDRGGVASFWREIARGRSVPAFWYAFPFRPHSSNELKQFRQATADDLAKGLPFLRLAIRILAPHTLFATDKEVEKLIRKEFPKLRCHSLPNEDNTFAFLADYRELAIP